MKLPTCLQCGEGPALILESLESLAEPHRYFCSIECAAVSGLMASFVKGWQWCHWCEKWVQHAQRRCPICHQTGTEGREHANAMGRG